MSDINVHHLAAAYALDALDDDERARFEQHSSSCDLCRADVADHRETAAALASLVSTPARPELKNSVLAEIGRTRQLAPGTGAVVRMADRRRPSRRATIVLATAAALAMFIAGAVVVGSFGGADLDDQIASVLADPDVRFVQLDAAGAGTVNIAWGNGRAVVVGDGLPSPGAGRAYELWSIDDTGAHPTRLLDRASDGRVRRVVDIEREPDVWGITIEPASGSAIPTEPILFVAEV